MRNWQGSAPKRKKGGGEVKSGESGREGTDEYGSLRDPVPSSKRKHRSGQ